MNEVFGKLLPPDSTIKATKYIAYNKGINWENDGHYWFSVTPKQEEKSDLKNLQ